MYMRWSNRRCCAHCERDHWGGLRLVNYLYSYRCLCSIVVVTYGRFRFRIFRCRLLFWLWGGSAWGRSSIIIAAKVVSLDGRQAGGIVQGVLASASALFQRSYHIVGQGVSRYIASTVHVRRPAAATPCLRDLGLRGAWMRADNFALYALQRRRAYTRCDVRLGHQEAARV